MENTYSSKEIFQILEHEILSLTIKPGSSISENTLCSRFGVSRTPIRSVLQQLALEGLVIITPYKGTVVTLLDFDIINQLIYNRMAVETFVLEDFMKICSALDLEKIRQLIEDSRQLIQDPDFDVNDFYAIDGKLHETWFHAVRKDYLWQSIQKSHCHYTRFRMLDIVAIKNFEQIIQEHEQILAVLRAEDPTAIRSLLHAHLFGGVSRLGRLVFTEYKSYFT